MEEGLDTGPVFATRAITIGEQETAGELHDRLARLGGELLIEKLPQIVAGELESASQDEAQATYAGKVRKRDASINWNDTAQRNARKVRAFNPVPGANFELGNEVIKCLRATVVDGTKQAAGTVVAAGKEGVDVACGDGVLRLLEVQRPGRRPITAGEFAAQTNPLGKRFGWLS